MAAQLRLAKVTGWIREAYLVPDRRFRVDIAFPGPMLAVECHGAEWRQGRHQTGAGFTRDCEKACLLAIQGWRWFPVTGSQIRSGLALQWLHEALHAAPDPL